MKWSWKVGTIAGIGVYVHATFLLIVGWVVLSHYLQGQSLAQTIVGVAFVLALFACVVAHEFGHALAARKYGIPTRDITLLPIGGVARLERMPDQPRQELWVALAGPAVNVVIAAVLLAVLVLTRTLQPLSELTLASGSFVERLMLTNLFLVGFNLIPAFPMDGGRVLRALLGMRLEYVRATQIAATIGQGIAFLFGFIGLFSNPFLVFIALFVWIGASQESRLVQMRSALAGIPVTRVMVSDYRTLSAQDTLQQAVNLLLSGAQQDFPVTADGRMIGVLTRAEMLRALATRGFDTPVAEVMVRDFQVADAAEMLDVAFARLQECNCQTMPVLRAGQLAGLLTADNLGEFLMIQSALSTTRRAQRGLAA